MREKVLSLLLGFLLTFLLIDWFIKRAEMRGCQQGVGGIINIMQYNATGQVYPVPTDKTHIICVDILRGSHE